MITDHIRNAETYYGLGPGIKLALHYLASEDLSKLASGQHSLADGAFAVVDEYETLPSELKQWEAHRKYIDVHFVVSGTELLEYADINCLTPETDYNDSADAMMLSGSAGSFLVVKPGVFAILYPHEAHKPGVTPVCPSAGQAEIVRKVVVKVPVLAGSR